MRFLNLLKTDLKFQYKQGFHGIYIGITLLYILILTLIPREWLPMVVPLLVFTDPSALGLFFIGGVAMLEKEQGIMDYIEVTPITFTEYVLSKVLTLSALATVVALIITIGAQMETTVNYWYLCMGVFFTSVFFIYVGLWIVIRCRNLNHYLMRMIPYLLVLGLPCVSILGFSYSWLLWIFPSVAGFNLIYGAFHAYPMGLMNGWLAYLVFTVLIITKPVIRKVENEMIYRRAA